MTDRKIDANLMTWVLYGSPDGMQYTQDSPVLRDVWLSYARRKDEPLDVLVVPWGECPASKLASLLHKRVSEFRKSMTNDPVKNRTHADIADMPGVVAATLYFDEFCNVLLPTTLWWNWSRIADFAALTARTQQAHIARWGDKIRAGMAEDRVQDLTTKITRRQKGGSETFWVDDPTCRMIGVIGAIASDAKRFATPDDIDPVIIGRAWTDLFQTLPKWARDQRNAVDPENLIYSISVNRPVESSIANSVPTTKADAALRLFDIDCSKISWAVIDSGIDRRHEAFLEGDPNDPPENRKSRVWETYDFARFRELRSRDILLTPQRRTALATKLSEENGIDKDRAKDLLKALADDADADREADFQKIRDLLQISDKIDSLPSSQHGTHVAGILGGKALVERNETYQGMCPDIRLYDFRVLSSTMKDTEFAVIGALRMVYHINTANNYRTIHGANLSISLPHDVMNFACGRTPVCQECEVLVKHGVVVVAAGGNAGYHEFSTTKGPVPLYAATSITDPGNADLVITVGATHRLEPHTYGVSYFSSRGPTGDGRMKPDLVAPGEKIRAAIPRAHGKPAPTARKGGTSMAAPHVSGAAAMIMARFPEFIGQPDRIKQILCETATDLGRDRTHQGAGLLDILRALQSV